MSPLAMPQTVCHSCKRSIGSNPHTIMHGDLTCYPCAMLAKNRELACVLVENSDLGERLRHSLAQRRFLAGIVLVSAVLLIAISAWMVL
jgi:hypothetical protein